MIYHVGHSIILLLTIQDHLFFNKDGTNNPLSFEDIVELGKNKEPPLSIYGITFHSNMLSDAGLVILENNFIVCKMGLKPSP